MFKLFAVALLVGSLFGSIQARQDSPGCTMTLGFWKTHQDAWWVDSLTLGDVIYTKDELILVLNEPVRGNGLISLAHQFIATLLNVASGANETAVQTEILASHAIIDELIIPPIGNDTLKPRETSELANTFADFNEGRLFPGHCENGPPPPPQCVGDLQTDSTSWIASGINNTARIVGPICSESGTFNISVFGTQVGPGAVIGSFILYEGLNDWIYDGNHLLQPDPVCVCATCSPCVDADGFIFASTHSAVFSFTRPSGTHRYTYVYGVRGFGHGFFDAHGEIFVSVP